MAYIGRDTDKISNIEKLDTITFNGSSSYTLQKNSVNFTPNSANSLQVSIDGVVQAGNFTVSGSTIDFGVAIPATSTNDFIFHYGTGLITTPADGTVGLAQLSATGTKDATTFLRGDNTFAEAGGGKLLQVLTATDSTQRNANITSFGTGSNTLSVTITPSATSSKILAMANFTTQSYDGGNIYFTIQRGSTNLGSTNGLAQIGDNSPGGPPAVDVYPTISMSVLDSPNTTSATTYQVYFKTTGTSIYGNMNLNSTMGTIIVMEIGA